MAKKTIPENVLVYKGKPLIRRGNLLYYGFSDDKFLACLIVEQTEKIADTDIATKVIIQLQTNDTDFKGKERIIKTLLWRLIRQET